MSKFTLEEAKKAKENNSLKQWTVDFLLAEGNNKHLAKEIEGRDNLWIELEKFPLNKLRREMGPKEEGLVFSEDKEIWDKRIRSLIKDIKDGYEPCPLIATDFWGDTHLADGAHRHEALLQAGLCEYWTIFIVSKKESIDRVFKSNR